jgi:hypothetical protein
LGFHKKWGVSRLASKIELIFGAENYFIADFSLKISYKFLFLQSGYTGRNTGRFKFSVLPVEKEGCFKREIPSRI